MREYIDYIGKVLSLYSSYGELVDAIMPGDRVSVTGIYRAGSIRLNYNRRNVKSVYRTHIDAIHFNKNQRKLLKHNNDITMPAFMPY